MVGDGSKKQELLYTSNAWVDVRDTALGHILALQKEAAGGERIIVSGGPLFFPGYILQETIIDVDNQDLSFGKNGVCVLISGRPFTDVTNYFPSRPS